MQIILETLNYSFSALLNEKRNVWSQQCFTVILSIFKTTLFQASAPYCLQCAFINELFKWSKFCRVLQKFQEVPLNFLEFSCKSYSAGMFLFFSSDQAVSIGCVLGWPGFPDYWYTSRYMYDDNLKSLCYFQACDVLMCRVEWPSGHHCRLTVE